MLTHNKDDVQLPRMETPQNQAVSQKKITPLLMVPNSTPVARATKDTSSLRVQSNSVPHIIPSDDDIYTNLPPPKLHPISVPTPKGGSFYIHQRRMKSAQCIVIPSETEESITQFF
eukprot:7261579-Ditylum_brightwellii.AAC.1